MTSAENTVALSETDAGKIFTFPQGIPGLETYTKYTVFHKGENRSSAYCLNLSILL